MSAVLYESFEMPPTWSAVKDEQIAILRKWIRRWSLLACGCECVPNRDRPAPDLISMNA